MTNNEVRELFQEILNSDMAMREEDEGQISPILQKIRQALTRTPSTNNEVVDIFRLSVKIADAVFDKITASPECKAVMSRYEASKAVEAILQQALSNAAVKPTSIIRHALIEAIGNYQGWEESAVAMVDECIMPIIEANK